MPSDGGTALYYDCSGPVPARCSQDQSSPGSTPAAARSQSGVSNAILRGVEQGLRNSEEQRRRRDETERQVIEQTLSDNAATERKVLEQEEELDAVVRAQAGRKKAAQSERTQSVLNDMIDLTQNTGKKPKKAAVRLPPKRIDEAELRRLCREVRNNDSKFESATRRLRASR